MINYFHPFRLIFRTNFFLTFLVTTFDFFSAIYWANFRKTERDHFFTKIGPRKRLFSSFILTANFGQALNTKNLNSAKKFINSVKLRSLFLLFLFCFVLLSFFVELKSWAILDFQKQCCSMVLIIAKVAKWWNLNWSIRGWT